MIQICKVNRDGTSVYIRLPMAMVRELGIRRGDHVLATVVGNCIAVAKIDPAKLLDQARVRSYGENVKNRGEP